MSEAVAPPVAEQKMHIDDLADPVLSAVQREALAFGEAHPVEFSEAAVLAAATAETGLAEFGPSDFRPRLRLWAQTAEEDTNLSAFGRYGIWREMVRFAGTRARAFDFLARHPQIDALAIDVPLVVAGLPRSGTTYLLQVLAADRRLRSLPYWEAVRPIAEPFIVDGNDTRHAGCAAEWEYLDTLLPLAKAIHPFDPDHISEDIEMMCLEFQSYYLDWLCHAPRWRDAYFAEDQRPSYTMLRRMMQALSFQHGPQRWVTKCPQHMEQLPTALAALPGSMVVITHRDPLASIQSAITAVAYRARVTHKSVDIPRIANYWVDRYERLLRACVRDHATLPPARLHDVYFHTLMADPAEALRAIYAKAGLPYDAQAEADLAAGIAANRRGRHGQLRYDFRADFGLDPDAVRARFGFYYDRFPVRIEVT